MPTRQRSDARKIPSFEIIELADVPGRAVPAVTNAEASDVDLILRALQKKPGLAARIHEPDHAKRESLGPLINRIAHARATAVKHLQSGDYLYIWLRSED
jgi:hypothetical protein